jgi:2-polyprenyl-3-methyl-5-hydroxy-6-metoxy-1,4-benzoquinol methylase
MKNTNASDCVEHFSNNQAEFGKYYLDNQEFRERVQVWRRLLDRYSVPNGLSLDMGCGTGVFALYLAAKGGRVVGVDAAVEMVKSCESQRRDLGYDNVTFIQARLPDVDETALGVADLLIGSSVLEYVERLDDTLALFARLLKPRGTLIVSMPNVLCISRGYQRLKHRLTGRPAIYNYIRHFTSPRRLQRRVRALGLTLREVCYYNHATRLAFVTRALKLPPSLTEDLFVVVFEKAEPQRDMAG